MIIELLPLLNEDQWYCEWFQIKDHNLPKKVSWMLINDQTDFDVFLDSMKNETEFCE
jgi:hypothetical protein